MHRIYAGMTVTAATLTLVACGGGDPEASQVDEAPATVTVTETATVTVAADPQESRSPSAPETSETLQEGEAAATDPPEPTAGEASANSTDEVSDTVSEEKDYGESVKSERGYLKKEIGQWAGIGDRDPLVSFRLTDIETDFTCGQQWAEPSANGQFVALTFEVETYPSLADEPIGDFSIGEYDIIMFDDSDTRENDSVGNAYMCLEERERLPVSIGPGQKANGKVIIDTGVTSGVLAVNSYLLGGVGGWEWPFRAGEG